MIAAIYSLVLGASGVAAQGPPIQTETAFVVGLEGAAVRTFVQLTSKSKWLQEGRAVADPLDRRMRVIAIPLILPYEEVSNRLVLGAGIPLLDNKLERAGARLGDRGWGDLSLFGKYQLWQRDAHRQTTRITLKGIVQLPTGKDRARDAEGALLPRSLQLGTGAIGWAIGPVFTRIAGRLGLYAAGLYKANGKADGYDYGDGLDYDLALGYRIYPARYGTYPSPYATLYLEANGRHVARSRSGGRVLAASGGHTLFMAPWVQFIPWATLVLETSVQIPVIQALNGAQQGTDYAFRTGIRWLIL